MKHAIIAIVLTIIALLTAVQAALAQTPDPSSLTTARQLYNDGEYVEAATLYQQFIDEGHESADLYYNLGNAYYNQGELGRAIANYLRAEEIDPRDPDVQANLNRARSQTEDSFSIAGRSLFARWVDAVSSWATLNELAVATLVIWMVFGLSIFALLLIRVRWIRGVFFYTAAISGVFLILSAITLFGRVSEDTASADAVIAVEVIDAVTGPGPQYTTEITLHDGTEAIIKDKKGNWVKIALFDGQTEGWVPASAIEEVHPNNQRASLSWTLPTL